MGRRQSLREAKLLFVLLCFSVFVYGCFSVLSGGVSFVIQYQGAEAGLKRRVNFLVDCGGRDRKLVDRLNWVLFSFVD